MRIIISNTSSDTIVIIASKNMWSGNYKYNKLYLNSYAMMSLFEDNLRLLKLMATNSKSLSLVNIDATSDVYDTMLLDKQSNHYLPFIKIDDLDKLFKRLNSHKAKDLDNVDILIPSPMLDEDVERLGKILHDNSRLVTSIDYRTGEVSPNITVGQLQDIENAIVELFKKFHDSGRLSITYRD